MTDQQNDERFDRQLRDFLAWQARDLADAPTATEMSGRISSHVQTRTFGLQLSRQLVWIVLAGLLILSLLAAAAVGALLLRPYAVVPPVIRTYEAIFVRWDVDTASAEVDLVVVAVDDEGHQREIGRIADAGIRHISPVELFSPRAAVSSTGVLVYPRPIPDGPSIRGVPNLFHWVIVDLANPAFSAMVVADLELDYDQLEAAPRLVPESGRGRGVFWGPGERLAVTWSERAADSAPRLTFVDGRTGTGQTVDVLAGLTVLPSWAADGSGVFVSADTTGLPHIPPQLMRPDGSVVDDGSTAAVTVCQTQYKTGAPVLPRQKLPGMVACLAPDESAIVVDRVRDTEDDEANPPPRQWAVLVGSESGTSFEVEGAFAGWLETSR